MGIEIVAGPNWVFHSDANAALVVGGEFDAFNGPITSAEAVTGLNPNIGDLLWSLDPNDVVLP